MERERTQCPACKREIALHPTRRFYWHRVVEWLGFPATPRKGNWCRLSNRRPEENMVA